MTNNRVFIAWQPVLTDHQAFTFQALANAAGIPVVAYVTVMEDAVRKAQGWADTQVSSVERRLIPKRGFLRYCYRQLHEHRAEVHLFASPFQQPRLMLCMLLAAWLGIEFYLISEPYSPNEDGYFSDTPKWIGKLKAAFRPMAYRVYALLLRRHAAGIFTISRLAFAQYQQAGISPAKLFLFGYFIPRDTPIPLGSSTPQLVPDDNLRIIFIGSLIRRKGVDLLQAAVQGMAANGGKVSADIYGPGDSLPISTNGTNIRYRGLIPFGQAQKVIASYDLLVLPSRYDGWGVVVNEALCAGVPVVCSDTTGAGEVAVVFGAGLCFTSGVASSLRDVLTSLVNDPALLKSMRTAVPLAAQALQPAVAARYMLDVIRAPAEMRPAIRSPWYPDHL